MSKFVSYLSQKHPFFWQSHYRSLPLAFLSSLSLSPLPANTLLLRRVRTRPSAWALPNEERSSAMQMSVHPLALTDGLLERRWWRRGEKRRAEETRGSVSHPCVLRREAGSDGHAWLRHRASRPAETRCPAQLSLTLAFWWYFSSRRCSQHSQAICVCAYIHIYTVHVSFCMCYYSVFFFGGGI